MFLLLMPLTVIIRAERGMGVDLLAYKAW